MTGRVDNALYTSIDDNIELLKVRGLIIENEEYAREVLSSTSYSSLIRPYASVFYNRQAINDKEFYSGTTFNEICELYNFDRKIRTLF